MSTKTLKEKSRIELSEIQKLIKMIERSPITEFELEESDLKIRISKNSVQNGSVTVSAPPQIMAGMAYAPAPQAASPAASPSPVAENRPPPANVVDVKAPMVGTFYSAPSPDADPYVKIGDVVEPGKVLCIVEAMKLMNEIEAEFRGKLVEVLVGNASPVEFGQVMFRLERLS